jgi:Tol biopolymer transport system component/DNA-binding winged helix-turn-helix (wHTH) protein
MVAVVTRFRFADVELDLDRFEVTRAGRRLSLEPKAVDVLRFFVERPGRLVTRDELLDGVWPGVAVTPNALTRVVAQLRRELGDDAADARYIETVPTRGYRFIAAVESIAPPAVAAAFAAASPAPVSASNTPAAVDAPLVRSSPRRPLVGWALAAAGAVLAVVAVGWQVGREASVAMAEGELVAVTGESGSIHAATFSPDGRWLALVSDRSGDFEIYLRDLNQPTSQPVTADGMRNVHPAWAPDSRRLVYHSSLRHGIWVTSIDGGPARQVAAFGSRPAWSPDGSTIVFQSDEFLNEFGQPGSQLWVVPAGGGAPRALTSPGAPPGGHGTPLWSPDGTLVYFVATRNVLYEQWSVRVADGLLTRRTTDKSAIVAEQLVTSPDGPLAIGTRAWSEGLDIIEVPIGDQGGEAQVRPVRTPPGRGVRSISMAPGGAVAAVVQMEMDGALVVMPVTASGAAAGVARTIARGNHPAMSPDGTRIAFDRGGEVRVVNLDGSGERGVLSGGRGNLYPSWVDDRRLVALRRVGLSAFLVEVDLETGRMTERVALPESASFPRIAPDGDTFAATVGEPVNTLGRGSLKAGTFAPWPALARYSFPVWSPDGRQLAVEMKQGRHMLMAVADVATGAVRQISPPEGQHWPGSFSPDGQRLAVASPGPTGIWNIEIVDVTTGERRQLTTATSPEHVARFPSWSPRGDAIVWAQTALSGTLSLVRPAARRPAR